eukprot:8851481-Prorocentrum_lima.AAC.1
MPGMSRLIATPNLKASNMMTCKSSMAIVFLRVMKIHVMNDRHDLVVHQAGGEEVHMQRVE